MMAGSKVKKKKNWNPKHLKINIIFDCAKYYDSRNLIDENIVLNFRQYTWINSISIGCMA